MVGHSGKMIILLTVSTSTFGSNMPEEVITLATMEST